MFHPCRRQEGVPRRFPEAKRLSDGSRSGKRRLFSLYCQKFPKKAANGLIFQLESVNCNWEMVFDIPGTVPKLIP